MSATMVIDKGKLLLFLVTAPLAIGLLCWQYKSNFFVRTNLVVHADSEAARLEAVEMSAKETHRLAKSMEERLQAVEAHVKSSGSLGSQQTLALPELADSSDLDDSVPATPMQSAQLVATSVQHAEQPGALSSNICVASGVCTVGVHTDVAIMWKAPPGKYEGAHCQAPARCKFGPDDNLYMGNKTRMDMLNCKIYANVSPTKADMIPSWVVEQGGAKKKYAEIEKKLKAMDVCVDRWRAQHMPKQRPCNRCHGIAAVPDLIKIHTELVSRLPHCRRICETGFNRGDSSLVLTLACGRAQSQGLSFSLDTRWYTRPGLGCLDKVLVGTQSSITQVEGFSTTSIRDFVARNSHSDPDLQCDVIHVDGGKKATIRMQDLVDLAPVAHKHTLWVTDDVEFPHPLRRTPHHCMYGVFREFARRQGFAIKCFAGSGVMGQCYGYSDWDSLFAASAP